MVIRAVDADVAPAVIAKRQAYLQHELRDHEVRSGDLGILAVVRVDRRDCRTLERQADRTDIEVHVTERVACRSRAISGA
eukprot:636531-Prymnesium_polylepis.1